MRRRQWIADYDPQYDPGTTRRDRVCAAEFVCEALGRDMGSRDYRELARKFGAYMRTMPGWQMVRTTKHAVNIYGPQMGFKRVADLDNDEEL